MYDTNNKDVAARGSPDTREQDDQALPTLALDPEKYREHLDGLEITDEQAAEFLQILWNIMHTMVDIGMGLDSIQILFAPCDENTGQDSGKDSTIEDRKISFNEVSSTHEKKV